MTNIAATSVPSLIKTFAIKHSIYINPGTIYPALNRLEKKGYIMRIPKRLTKLFSLTVAGRKLLEVYQQHIDELIFLLYELIGKKQGDQ